MDRDVALRIDGPLNAVRSSLDGLAHYVNNNCSEAEFKRIARQIGAAMGWTIDISNALYQEHPDIVPRELQPPGRPRKRTESPILKASHES
jgi:hypothetical protein